MASLTLSPVTPSVPVESNGSDSDPPAESLWSRIQSAGPQKRQRFGHRRLASLDDAAFLTEARSFHAEWARRDPFVNTFSWAVPSPEAIARIAEFVGSARVVEINAGRGLWSSLLQSAGVKVIATDIYPPIDGTFTSVIPVEATVAVQQYLEPGGVLMTCWPDYAMSYATAALKAAVANSTVAKVVYIGEWDGCTGDAELHEIFEREFDQVQCVKIPQWEGIHDALYLLQKK
jgi:hypothetical protein